MKNEINNSRSKKSGPMESNTCIDLPPEKGRGTPPNPSIADLVTRFRNGDTRALARAISLVENERPRSTGPALRLLRPHRPGNPHWHHRLPRCRQEHPRRPPRTRFSRNPGGARRRQNCRRRRRRPHQPFHRWRHPRRPHPLPGTILRTPASTPAAWPPAAPSAGSPSPPPTSPSYSKPAAKTFILIETVGVGQDEIEIARLADITLVVLVPGMGDDVQSLKAGVMEIADIFVVNKSDREGADRVEQEDPRPPIAGLRSPRANAPRHPHHRHHRRRHRRPRRRHQ